MVLIFSIIIVSPPCLIRFNRSGMLCYMFCCCFDGASLNPKHCLVSMKLNVCLHMLGYDEDLCSNSQIFRSTRTVFQEGWFVLFHA